LPQPIDKVAWLHVDELKANNYNPNRVAPPELELLKISIIEDGWTQPIVITDDKEIVDGFHRYLACKSDTRVYRKTHGYVPTVVIAPKDLSSKQMATIRHNRARGTHTVLAMSKIVQSMVEKEKLSMKEICERLQMEPEEVTRLAARVGIPQSDILGAEWSKEWVPAKVGGDQSVNGE
jgi:ParB-like chromosome segregation protein Spo0J